VKRLEELNSKRLVLLMNFEQADNDQQKLNISNKLIKLENYILLHVNKMVSKLDIEGEPVSNLKKV
jgi:hypothetical protein